MMETILEWLQADTWIRWVLLLTAMHDDNNAYIQKEGQDSDHRFIDNLEEIDNYLE